MPTRGTGLVWIVAEPGEFVGDLLAELERLGLASRRVLPGGAGALPGLPAVLLVVASRNRPSTFTRRACTMLRDDPHLREVPIVLVMPPGPIPLADPVLDAHELIVRPLRPGELLSRIGRAAAAMPDRAALDLTIRVGALRLDPCSRQVWIGAAEVPFTAREFELLEYLARHPARVHSRRQLLLTVWSGAAGVRTRAVDVQVRRVRAKLGDDLGRCIRTVRNVGYVFDAPAARSALRD